MKASKLKWVNPVLNTIGVNSLMLGGLQMVFRQETLTLNHLINFQLIKSNKFTKDKHVNQLNSLTNESNKSENESEMWKINKCYFIKIRE